MFPVKLKGDRQIWAVFFILVTVSILAVYSSTYKQTMRSGNLFGELFSHMRFLGAGFILVYVLHRIPFPLFKRHAPGALLFIVLLLLITMLFSKSRWMFRVQPSEFARLIIIVYLAKVISEGFKKPQEYFWMVLVPVGTVCILIIDRHTSSVLMIGFTSLLLILMGVSNRKYLAMTFWCISGACCLYFMADQYLGRSETAKSRVSAFVDKILDKPDSSKQEITQAQIAEFAMNSGSFLSRLKGKGPGNSVYRVILPEANNDYIYAIIVEEYGTLGALLIMFLYFWLFYRVVIVISKSNKVFPSKVFPSLLLSGMILMIVTQALVHIGVSIGVLPVTGQNLPMISTGGTSIMVTSAAFGIILSVSNAVNEKERRLDR